MTEERKADVEAAIAALEYELWLAIRQGSLVGELKWTKAIDPPGATNPYVVLLTVAEVKA
jgi:hypothetical protein